MMMAVRDMGAVVGIAVFQMVFARALAGLARSPAAIDPVSLIPGFPAAFGAVAASVFARGRGW
ncbi:MAG: hypothetical protein ACP5C4_05610 [Methanomicrobiales archaeon]